MAFDRPLEADRVDDLGLFSAFIRAPVVGTLMWILGGSKAMKEEEKQKEMLNIAQGEDAGTSFADDSLSLQSNRYVLTGGQTNGRLKKTAPRLIGSDISDFGELALNDDGDYENLHRTSSGNVRKGLSTLRNTRKMSWSDESGQSLVEYIDESTFAYEPTKFATSTTSSTAKPIKSAMRRSSSVSEDASGLGQGSTPRYLPKGLGGGHSGLVIPTRPGDVASTGYHSPEWGWYINTTPPTPDMYYQSHSSKKSSYKDPARTSVLTTPSQLAAQSLATPTFKNHINAPAKNSMGWPSVPL